MASKKEKILLTPEQKEERAKQRKEIALKGLKEGFIPFLIQIAILAIVILFFVFCIYKKSTINISPIDEKIGNDPNLIRFIYMFVALILTGVLLYFSSKSQSVLKKFWLSLLAGIALWQVVGECSWHFCLFEDGNPIYFPRIEGTQGIYILLIIIPVLLYANKKKAFPWFVQIFILSFMLNWCGHFVIEGIAPMWPTSLRYHNPTKWPKLVGFLIGLHGSLLMLYKIFFKANTTQERLVYSLMLYTFIGIFVEGVFGVGGSLQ